MSSRVCLLSVSLCPVSSVVLALWGGPEDPCCHGGFGKLSLIVLSTLFYSEHLEGLNWKDPLLGDKCCYLNSS